MPSDYFMVPPRESCAEHSSGGAKAGTASREPLPDRHPLKTFACSLALHARDIHTGESGDPQRWPGAIRLWSCRCATTCANEFTPRDVASFAGAAVVLAGVALSERGIPGRRNDVNALRSDAGRMFKRRGSDGQLSAA